MDMSVDRQIRHHTNAVLGRIAAFLHQRLPGQITPELAEEMMKVANETKSALPQQEAEKPNSRF